ncbi:MAG: FAD-dependent oxidoreductase [Steroidobacteraceae bacterium]
MGSGAIATENALATGVREVGVIGCGALALTSALLLQPASTVYAPGSHPFGARTVHGRPWMMFNLNAYMRLLMSDFLESGGKIQVTEFHSPADFGSLQEKTLVNATGYGARALFGDETLVPVRGQLARTIPQPEIHYGLAYKDSNFVPRRDGNIFQVFGEDDYYGVGDDSTAPDPADAHHPAPSDAPRSNQAASDRPASWCPVPRP